MRYEEKQPAPELQPFIQCFWYLERDYREPDGGEVIWPAGCQEMIFHYGASYISEGVPPPGRCARYWLRRIQLSWSGRLAMLPRTKAAGAGVDEAVAGCRIFTDEPAGP